MSILPMKCQKCGSAILPGEEWIRDEDGIHHPQITPGRCMKGGATPLQSTDPQGRNAASNNGGPVRVKDYIEKVSAQLDAKTMFEKISMRAYIATHISDGDIEAKMGAYANPQAKTRAQARVMCADALLAELAKS